MHYERPVNTKLERAATREWLWEGQRLYNMMPEVKPIDLKEKYAEQIE